MFVSGPPDVPAMETASAAIEATACTPAAGGLHQNAEAWHEVRCHAMATDAMLHAAPALAQ